eukprot:CAMPEP_0202449436 /NCGR_PEP_ID=MMETSP1360-20130828/8171_1 /ASSEMBLY_ACC=CAM_ASM_000848 /TAXON_ID=515479 /ORGANISM="Licmophora paradoxa, Strain CCMP2313" /LENGTH=370 /DNA_ID=CAMNT_0049067365 /DNA_START=44 /DNA_END=1156 /DNA_ORIENTATION=+
MGNVTGVSILIATLVGFAMADGHNSVRALRNVDPAERTPVHHAFAKECTPEELDLLKRNVFVSSPDKLMQLSHVPVTSWKDKMIREDQIYQPKPFYRVITVGCNKGMDAIGTARFLSRNPVFDKTRWYDEMCHEAKIDEFNLIYRTKDDVLAQCPLEEGEDVFEVDVHCVEPLPVNIDAILKTNQELGMEKYGFHAHRYAISDVPGTAQFPSGVAPGSEAFGISSCKNNPMYCEDVEQITVDELAKRHFQPGTPEQVDILMIDAEGYDFHVLKGAKETLKNTRFIEFEYHSFWGEEKLEDAEKFLADLGFVCYYEGIERLYRISKGCWIPEYEAHVWSNVACVHESEFHWVSMMESSFLGSLYSPLNLVN